MRVLMAGRHCHTFIAAVSSSSFSKPISFEMVKFSWSPAPPSANQTSWCISSATSWPKRLMAALYHWRFTSP